MSKVDPKILAAINGENGEAAEAGTRKCLMNRRQFLLTGGIATTVVMVGVLADRLDMVIVNVLTKMSATMIMAAIVMAALPMKSVLIAMVMAPLGGHPSDSWHDWNGNASWTQTGIVACQN